MKTIRASFFALIGIFLATTINACVSDATHPRQVASANPAESAQLLQQLQANRIGTQWSCTKGGNPKAVEIFNVKSTATNLVQSERAMVINDAQICSALGVSCPFVSGVLDVDNEHGNIQQLNGPKYAYWCTRGQYEDTVSFYSDGGGMKISTVSNEATPKFTGKNWFFHAGDCILH